MRGRVFIVAAVLIAGASAQARAGSIKLSGNYIVSESKSCQAVLTPVTDLAVTGVMLSGGVISANTNDFLTSLNADTGKISASVGLVKFSAGAISGTITEGKGASVDYNGLGEPITSDTSSVSGSFSTTATSVTITGTNYQGFAGGLTPTGIATKVRLINVTPPCIETLSLDHQ